MSVSAFASAAVLTSVIVFGRFGRDGPISSPLDDDLEAVMPLPVEGGVPTPSV